ncbi:hypothetical protein FQA39_LY18758 [Lamprigera yunnana]|nr:hypothetical protein FQA39_LY18758 [Lamprigera yunnana]
MHCVYAQENYSCLAAARTEFNLITKLLVIFLIDFGDTGQFKPKSDVGLPKNLTCDQENDILVPIANNAELSIRRLPAVATDTDLQIFRGPKGLSKEAQKRVCHQQRDVDEMSMVVLSTEWAGKSYVA